MIIDSALISVSSSPHSTHSPLVHLHCELYTSYSCDIPKNFDFSLFMACFKALCCFWRPPSPNDDAVVPQVPAPVGAAQPPASTDIRVPALTEVPVEASDSPSVNTVGVRAATAVENTRPHSPAGPSPSNAGIPAPAPAQGGCSHSLWCPLVYLVA
ncbi:hypothetical protein M404DRAFT_433633 [Pisolithus tinctorius Marx 270]|uniref:Uncharacterized protein n=1 Tax=Pisolithus tinctorius Marx 270 TaxID=870435 RepID=A0A0C3NE77_PISTI|nr:hypothetical protein M404DRAFT_515110 [Pisolithus tinctorius Marx 270]KIN93823.1 hypothetical protein M404DRAFT_433633 [Pisolithus tinctorius Marx 270]